MGKNWIFGQKQQISQEILNVIRFQFKIYMKYQIYRSFGAQTKKFNFLWNSLFMNRLYNTRDGIWIEKYLQFSLIRDVNENSLVPRMTERKDIRRHWRSSVTRTVLFALSMFYQSFCHSIYTPCPKETNVYVWERPRLSSVPYFGLTIC